MKDSLWKKALFLGAVALVPSGTGCRSCTLMYMPSTLTVVLDSGSLEAGRYEIEVSELPFGGYETAMCVVDIPWNTGDPVTCSGNAYLAPQPDGLQAFYTWEFVPERFTVTVLLDGEVLAEEDFEPAYAKTQPNGKGCGTSYSGSVMLAL